MTSNISKKSYDKNNVSSKTKATEDIIKTPSSIHSLKHPKQEVAPHTKDRLGVTALIAIMEPATENTSKEPQSTCEATKRLIHILDANMKKRISGQLSKTTAHTSVSQNKQSYWSSYKNLRSYLAGN
eukprot:CCRYP_007253-RC/>CCRYP_007253-RC protein AED:0.47 eAED:1.00 QI:0/0/0/1/0/0/2/0/126